jgi:hypothetical protein
MKVNVIEVMLMNLVYGLDKDFLSDQGTRAA